MGITIKDIAKKADVSVSTVSRVLNDKPDVNEKTKKKVEKIINELNYNPNSIARGLASDKTNTIGLIIPSIDNPFFPAIAKGVEIMARKLGFSVILCNTDDNPKYEEEIINLMQSKRVDGIIGSFCHQDINKLNNLLKSNLPVVQIDRKIEGFNRPAVTIDNVLSGYIATKHLIELGHEKIAHITGSIEISNTQDRVKGFKKAINESGIPFNEEWVLYGNPHEENAGYKEMENLLNQEERPTAFFIGSDFLAIRAYSAVMDQAMNIPEDISIVGHDDIDITNIIRPSLTTIKQPKFKLGQKAVGILFNLINNNENYKKEISLKPELIVRNSTSEL